MKNLILFVTVAFAIQASAAVAPVPRNPVTRYDTLVQAVAAISAVLPPSEQRTIEIDGFDTREDGRGGRFLLVPGDITPADGGIVIAVPGGKLKRKFTGPVQSVWFTGKPDGVTDVTAGLKAAIHAAAFGELQLPKGTNLYSSTIILSNMIQIVGEGSGFLWGHTETNALGMVFTNATVSALKMTGTGVGIRVHAKGVTLKDFGVLGSLSNTNTGVMVGDDGIDATGTIMDNIVVRNFGGDGIWIANCNCGYFSVRPFVNGGHGIRIESYNTGYHNVNANIIRTISTGNTLSGVYVFQAADNDIWFTSEGNYQYGAYINFPENTIGGYTEGNILGGVQFGPSGFGTFGAVKTHEGHPGSGPFNVVYSHSHTNMMFQAMQLRLMDNGRTLLRATVDDGTNDFQVAGSTYTSGNFRSGGRTYAQDLVINDGKATADTAGVFNSLNFDRPNDLRAPMFYGQAGTDVTLGKLTLNVGVFPSATAASRYGYLQVGDSDFHRTMSLQPDGGAVAIGTTSAATGSALTVRGNSTLPSFIENAGGIIHIQDRTDPTRQILIGISTNVNEETWVQAVEGTNSTTLSLNPKGGAVLVNGSPISSGGGSGDTVGGLVNTNAAFTSGLLKLDGNRTNAVPAVAGTDYVSPGDVGTSGLTMATDRLLGRTTAGPGAPEGITVGSGLSLVAGDLFATGNITEPMNALGAGTVIDVTKRYNVKAIDADATFTFSATPTIGRPFGIYITNSAAVPKVISIPESYSAKTSAQRLSFTQRPGMIYLSWVFDGTNNIVTDDAVFPTDYSEDTAPPSTDLAMVYNSTSGFRAAKLENIFASALSFPLFAGSTNVVDMAGTKIVTNLITNPLSFAHVTNGLTGYSRTVIHKIRNTSGGDLAFTIPSTLWLTNAFTPVPAAITNGWELRMIVTAEGDTSTSAKQTNALVSFMHFKLR